MDRQDSDFHGTNGAWPGSPMPRRGDRDVEGALDAYVREHVLLPQEFYLWRGRPSPDDALHGQLKGALIVGAMFVILPTFLLWGFEESGLYPMLFLALFVAVGLWQASEPWRARRRAERSYYAVTDRRVLIIQVTERGTQVTSIAPAQILRYEMQDFGNGRGNITLRETVTEGRRGQSKTVEFEDALWGVDFPAAADAVRLLLADRGFR